MITNFKIFEDNTFSIEYENDITHLYLNYYNDNDLTTHRLEMFNDNEIDYNIDEENDKRNYFYDNLYVSLDGANEFFYCAYQISFLKQRLPAISDEKYTTLYSEDNMSIEDFLKKFTSKMKFNNLDNLEYYVSKHLKDNPEFSINNIFFIKLIESNPVLSKKFDYIINSNKFDLI